MILLVTGKEFKLDSAVNFYTISMELAIEIKQMQSGCKNEKLPVQLSREHVLTLFAKKMKWSYGDSIIFLDAWNHTFFYVDTTMLTLLKFYVLFTFY